MNANNHGLPLEFSESSISRATKEPPIDGVELLNDIEVYYRKYVRLQETAYAVLPPWILHTHVFKAFSRTLYVHVTSPTVICGKTTVLEITELIVPNPLQTAGLSEAVLARVIEKEHPVLLLDELDELQKGNRELLAAIMATINSGYKRSGCRIVLVQKGKDWEPKRLSTFCPKMLASIGNLPSAAASRSIEIRMTRLGPGESVQDVDELVTEPEANVLFLRAQDWGRVHLGELRDARPSCPPELRNRQREVSRPLLAVADCAGGPWPERVRSALVTLFAKSGTNEQTTNVKLLEDIRTIFSAKDVDRLPSTELTEVLGSIEESQWGEYSNGRKITASALAGLLKGFEIAPRNIKLGDGSVRKGYLQDQFAGTWNHYLPPLPQENAATPLPSSIYTGPTHFSEALPTPLVAPPKAEEKPINMRVVAEVAAKNPGNGGLGPDREMRVEDGHGFPRCPRCSSYCLYREDNRGDYECQTCRLQAISEAQARMPKEKEDK